MEHVHRHEEGDHTKPRGVAQDGSLNKHSGHYTQDFLKKFWITLVLTVPIFFVL